MVNKVIYTSHTDYFSSEHTLLGTQQHYQFAGVGGGGGGGGGGYNNVIENKGSIILNTFNF